MPILSLVAQVLIILSLLGLTAGFPRACAEPRQGIYLEIGYFTRLWAGSPTYAWGGDAHTPVALEVRPRHDSPDLEAIGIWNWHEGEPVALSPEIESWSCNCDGAGKQRYRYEIIGNDPPEHLTIRNREDDMRLSFRWAGPVADIAVAYHAIGGAWHDSLGNPYIFTETGEWLALGRTYRYRILLDHVFYHEGILEITGEPTDPSVPRTEDGKPYLIFELPRPDTLVLRRLHHNGQNVLFPYDPGEVWRILRR